MIAAAMTAGLAAQTPPTYSTPDLEGKLYKSVFLQGPGALTAADTAKLPDATRTRLARFLERRAAFKSQLPGGASSMEAVSIEAKKRQLERGVFALIDAPGVEKLALEFAQGAKVVYEWEKQAAGPLAEATYAEDALKQNPSTPIAPYLYVYIALRQRAAFETMNVVTQKDAMNAAAKKYRTFMQRARSVEDPIFTLLADDIDRLPFVYLKSEFHPKDFNPDT